jgi:DNA topoisomerase-1
MKLLIVESPSKAKTIEKYLKGEFVVRSSVGHIRDLPKSNKNAIDIEGGFIPRYVADPKKKNVIDELKDLAKKSSEILLATDPDREGEAIAWHIKDELHLKDSKRVTFHEITEKAVREALLHPREIDMNLKAAQEARRILDRLVGYDLSQVIWKKVRYGLSAGRVQSPALRILTEREKEIRDFIPETYFTLTAHFEIEGKIKESKKYNLIADCTEEPKTFERAHEIETLGKKSAWKIRDIEESIFSKNPKAPFTTSTLQQAASSRLGYAPKKTMTVAQKLYEKGLITYMRTDSTNLSADSLAQIKNVVLNKFGDKYYESRVYKTKSKNAQEAHEAIRPTHIENANAGINDDEQRLYSLIWKRTIASQMSAAKYERTKIIFKCENEKVPEFNTNGSVLIFDGFTKVDDDSAGEENKLPKVASDSQVNLQKINSEEKQTLPPQRYSEAGLIKELEKRGIGRPSTYASIISTIEDRGYVYKENKALHVSDTGEVVSDFLNKNFTKYISDDFTSKMEDDLDEIANGDKKYLDVLKTFYDEFLQVLKDKKDIEKATIIEEAPADIKCPKCGADMVIKLSRSGKFYSCKNFENKENKCDGARKIDGTIMEGPKLLGKICPKCGKAELVERDGKYGKFIACSNYPKCKHIEKSDEQKARANTGIKCNKCKDGMMEERRGRFGIFYSCSNYPDCKNAIKAKPTGNFCPICNEMMMEGTKTIPERCSNKSCKNHNPHKMS